LSAIPIIISKIKTSGICTSFQLFHILINVKEDLVVINLNV